MEAIRVQEKVGMTVHPIGQRFRFKTRKTRSLYFGNVLATTLPSIFQIASSTREKGFFNENISHVVRLIELV